ncbi:hypothetical protein E2C01_047881 [Portunus trituberculatus]|uniref:Uncharacterized protein n=1 Tax=Portunus trituberculatus TaxID=210409 RepID=A0A5B7G925_PORTR|nr:hypothetical protein [Portunus trituberculatus]
MVMVVVVVSVQYHSVHSNPVNRFFQSNLVHSIPIQSVNQLSLLQFNHSFSLSSLIQSASEFNLLQSRYPACRSAHLIPTQHSQSASQAVSQPASQLANQSSHQAQQHRLSECGRGDTHCATSTIEHIDCVLQF